LWRFLLRSCCRRASSRAFFSAAALHFSFAAPWRLPDFCWVDLAIAPGTYRRGLPPIPHRTAPPLLLNTRYQLPHAVLRSACSYRRRAALPAAHAPFSRLPCRSSAAHVADLFYSAAPLTFCLPDAPHVFCAPPGAATSTLFLLPTELLLPYLATLRPRLRCCFRARLAIGHYPQRITRMDSPRRLRLHLLPTSLSCNSRISCHNICARATTCRLINACIVSAHRRSAACVYAARLVLPSSILRLPLPRFTYCLLPAARTVNDVCTRSLRDCRSVLLPHLLITTTAITYLSSLYLLRWHHTAIRCSGSRLRSLHLFLSPPPIRASFHACHLYRVAITTWIRAFTH